MSPQLQFSPVARKSPPQSVLSNSANPSPRSVFSSGTRSTFTTPSICDGTSGRPDVNQLIHDSVDLPWDLSTQTGPWTCTLCSKRRKYTTPDALKEHVASSHVCRYFHYCQIAGCGWYSDRLDAAYGHLGAKHANVVCMSNDLNGLIHSADAPPPKGCSICQAPVSSWDGYFSCFGAHCHLPEDDGSLSESTNMEEAPPFPQYIDPAELLLAPSDGQGYCQKRPNPCETEPATEGDRGLGMISEALGDDTRLDIDIEKGEGEGHRRKRIKQEPTNVDQDASSQSSLEKDNSPLSQTTGGTCRAGKAGGFSPAISMRTDITTPEYDADASIDAGITQPNDLSCILDAANHYGSLEELELKTARMCGFDGNLELQDQYSSLVDCITSLIQIMNAFQNLKTEGFCGSLISILVEDPSQPGIATAFQISLDEITSLANSLHEPREPIMKHFSTLDTLLPLARKLQGEESPLTPSEDWLQELSFVGKALRVGLLSFSGSHVCRFDMNITGQPMENIPVGLGYGFSLRKLACLDNFIGGPAWILGKMDSHTPSREMRLSLTVQDLQELWGPVWFLGDSPDKSQIIRTERGYVVPLPEQSPTAHGIECHWTKELPQSLMSQEHRPILESTSRILIGTDSTKFGLTVNHKCELDISLVQQQIACQLQLPGASRPRFIDDGYEVSLTGGKWITPGLTKKWKPMPARTQKTMLIEMCTKSSTPLAPLLRRRVGLEISACTGNARRVTLWEALRLSQATANDSSGDSYLNLSCGHEIGDRNCISSCWDRHRSTDEIDSPDYLSGGYGLSKKEARHLIVDSILALEHTGIDGEGNMQAWWGFSDGPLTCRISRATAEGSSNWFRIVKDTRDMSTFAVLSQRCLDTESESLCVRGCSSSSCKNGHMRVHRTGLYTRFLSTEWNSACLAEGAKFLVGGARLAVERPFKVSDRAAAILAAVSNNPLRYKLEGFLPAAGGRVMHVQEQSHDEITTGFAVPALVY